MGLFDRLRRLIRASVNDTIRRHEDDNNADKRLELRQDVHGTVEREQETASFTAAFANV